MVKKYLPYAFVVVSAVGLVSSVSAKTETVEITAQDIAAAEVLASKLVQNAMAQGLTEEEACAVVIEELQKESAAQLGFIPSALNDLASQGMSLVADNPLVVGLLAAIVLVVAVKPLRSQAVRGIKYVRGLPGVRALPRVGLPKEKTN
ncbi:hypothetical protein FJ364_03690 [Candidatus Dependentiae bacterium]|nr:hypothetical protein [Candidatus Dependentiae bacterium]